MFGDFLQTCQFAKLKALAKFSPLYGMSLLALLTLIDAEHFYPKGKIAMV